MLEVFDMFDWFELKKVSGVFSHVQKCYQGKKILQLFIIETTFCYTMLKITQPFMLEVFDMFDWFEPKKVSGVFLMLKNVHLGKKFLKLFIIETTFCYNMLKNHTTFHVGSV